MSISNEDLIKALSEKSVMEVVELVKSLEEEWGVSAAAPVAVPQLVVPMPALLLKRRPNLTW
jgi:ribosomal protein L7/L12